MQELMLRLTKKIKELKKSALYKSERIITSPQNAIIRINRKKSSIFVLTII